MDADNALSDAPVATPEQWAMSRQGARNIAGVSWQLSVTAHLLVLARAEQLPFVRLIPEGLEDIDCQDSSGATIRVQVKERNAGNSTLTARDVAEVLVHALGTGDGLPPVLVTDARLGSGLAETGWESTIGEVCESDVVEALRAQTEVNLGSPVESSYVAGARIIVLPYRLREHTERIIWETYECSPAIAGLVLSELIGLCAEHAAGQRNTSPVSPRLIALSDLDALAVKMSDTTDPASLEEAIREAVCTPVDFVTRSEISEATYFLGVDGSPAHIAAGLDVGRPREMELCAAGLLKEGSVVITGPSGCGKSMLLWRAARDLMPSARVVKVLRVAEQSDVEHLVRYVRLARPSHAAPVLVVADNLGRPVTAVWASAAQRLRELPHVYLLGSAREEDFNARLIVGPTARIEPNLDRGTAEAIAQRIADAGLEVRMGVAEAEASAQGLLMEFIALLTHGQRLEATLEQQVESLRAPDRSLQRDAALLLTTAHALGLALDASRLATEVVRTSAVSISAAEVGDALAVLNKEHIVVQDGATWRGLHELRSSVLSRLLHASPPPSLAETCERLVRTIRPSEVGWFLRRLSEDHADACDGVLAALPEVVGNATARDAASILEGAERADNAAFVRAAIPRLETLRKPGLSLADLMTFGIAFNHGVFSDAGNEGPMAQIGALAKTIAASLPDRSDHRRFVLAASSGLSEARLAHLFAECEVRDALRLAEIVDPDVPIPLASIEQLLARAGSGATDLLPTVRHRLIASLWTRVSRDDQVRVFGSTYERAEHVAASDRASTSVEVQPAQGQVTCRRLYPLELRRTPRLDWDAPEATSAPALNDDVVGMVESLADACPELHLFEVVTIGPDNSPYRDLTGREPGHKRIPRSNLPPRQVRRQSGGIMAALARQAAAPSATELDMELESIATTLNAALRELPLRLRPSDNASRLRAWALAVAAADDKLATSSVAKPQATQFLGLSDAELDETSRRSSEAVAGLRAVATALTQVAERTASGGLDRPLLTAMSLRDARSKLIALPDTGSEQVLSVLRETAELLAMCATLSMVLEENPQLARRIDARDPVGSARTICASAEEGWRRALMAAASVVTDNVRGVEAVLVEDPNPNSWAPSSVGVVLRCDLGVVNDVTAALDSDWGTELRVAGCRVAVLANCEGFIESDQAVGALIASNTALGLGAIMLGGESGKTFPLLADSAREWAQAAKMHFVEQAIDDDPMSAATDLSWRCVHRALTTLENSPDSGALADALGAVTTSLRDWAAALELSHEETAELGDHVDTIADQIRDEVNAVAPGSLFGASLSLVAYASPTPHEARLVEALSFVGIVGAIARARTYLMST